jgi:hypothetical protein
MVNEIFENQQCRMVAQFFFAARKSSRAFFSRSRFRTRSSAPVKCQTCNCNEHSANRARVLSRKPMFRNVGCGGFVRGGAGDEWPVTDLLASSRLVPYPTAGQPERRAYPRLVQDSNLLQLNSQPSLSAVLCNVHSARTVQRWCRSLPTNRAGQDTLAV